MKTVFESDSEEENSEVYFRVNILQVEDQTSKY